MAQYDAGPGDWSDREWESPDRKRKPQAKRRFTLPPWALLTGLIAVVILLCVGLVALVRAIREGGRQETPTALPAEASEMALPTATYPLIEAPTGGITPTATAVLPISLTVSAETPTEIGPGAQVVVKGTGGAGLYLRAEPGGTRVGAVKEGTELTVLDGPQESGGLTWWKVRAVDGKEGWAASDYLMLKP